MLEICGFRNGYKFKGRLAQLARAPALQAGGHRFKSRTAHLCNLLFLKHLLFHTP